LGGCLHALALFGGEGACDLSQSLQDRFGIIVSPQIFFGPDDPEADAVTVKDDRRLLGSCQDPGKLALRIDVNSEGFFSHGDTIS
jgi:hypothetical protein